MKKLTTLVFTIMVTGIFSGPLVANTTQVEQKNTKSMVRTHSGAGNGDYFPVEFTAIDGENINDREAIWLEAGTYLVTVKVPAKYTRSVISTKSVLTDEYVDFKLQVNPDEKVIVRGKYNRQDRSKPYELLYVREQ